jgi:hypothetical protein
VGGHEKIPKLGREKMIFEILKAGIGIQRRVDQLLWPAPSK